MRVTSGKHRHQQRGSCPPIICQIVTGSGTKDRVSYEDHCYVSRICRCLLTMGEALFLCTYEDHGIEAASGFSSVYESARFRFPRNCWRCTCYKCLACNVTGSLCSIFERLSPFHLLITLTKHHKGSGKQEWKLRITGVVPGEIIALEHRPPCQGFQRPSHVAAWLVLPGRLH